jgi:hypothetical protein
MTLLLYRRLLVVIKAEPSIGVAKIAKFVPMTKFS